MSANNWFHCFLVRDSLMTSIGCPFREGQTNIRLKGGMSECFVTDVCSVKRTVSIPMQRFSKWVGESGATGRPAPTPTAAAAMWQDTGVATTGAATSSVKAPSGGMIWKGRSTGWYTRRSLAVRYRIDCRHKHKLWWTHVFLIHCSSQNTSIHQAYSFAPDIGIISQRDKQKYLFIQQ